MMMMIQQEHITAMLASSRLAAASARGTAAVYTDCMRRTLSRHNSDFAAADGRWVGQFAPSHAYMTPCHLSRACSLPVETELHYFDLLCHQVTQQDILQVTRLCIRCMLSTFRYSFNLLSISCRRSSCHTFACVVVQRIHNKSNNVEFGLLKQIRRRKTSMLFQTVWLASLRRVL